MARGGGAAKKEWGGGVYASEPRASPSGWRPVPNVLSVRRLFWFLAGPELRVPFPLPKTGFTNLADVARLSFGDNWVIEGIKERPVSVNSVRTSVGVAVSEDDML